MQWYAPVSFNMWKGRTVTLRSLMLMGVVFIFLATEFYFGWCEQMVGAYLVGTNNRRPQSGPIWEQGHQVDSARQTLSQYANALQGAQQVARRATSMGQVVAGIKDNKGAMISAGHFIELYLKLPPVLSHEMLSPYTLLAHLSSGQWRRTFFEQQDKQLAIYFLDGQNQVLHRLSVGSGLLAHIQSGEVAIQTSLYHLADFAAHIFPAEYFFSTLMTLPAAVREGIIAHPEDLLRVTGRIVRVGISNRTMGGTIDVGFEVETIHGAKVILVQGRESDVRQLLHLSEPASVSGGLPGDEVQP